MQKLTINGIMNLKLEDKLERILALELDGQVEGIIYCNELNSYTIARLMTENVRRDNYCRVFAICEHRR